MNNTIILKECVNNFGKQNGLNLPADNLFEFFSAVQITKNRELTYDDIESGIVDGSKDGGVDLFYILIGNTNITTEDFFEEVEDREVKELSLIIGQSKLAKNFKESTVDEVNISIPLIFDLEKDDDELRDRFNAELFEKIKLFHLCWKKAVINGWDINIGYYFNYMGNEKNLTPSCKSKLRQVETLTSKYVRNADISVEVLSSNELLDLYNKKKSDQLQLKFKETPLSISYKDGQLGYIGVVNLEDYNSFIKDDEGNIIERIFESNVRHYQGSVDVNKRIKKTIENDYDVDFWWLNNGITIIASEVGQIGKTLSLKGVQIVNGLQTSFTLGSSYDNHRTDDSRSLLVKIIVNKDKETIDKIISATNSQSPVSPTLLRATDPVQRRIEDYFYLKGYFYDRRKNYYKNQGKPASKIIGIQNAAQAINSIMNYDPTNSRSKPTTLIKTEESYNKIFDKNMDFQIHLNCCIIYNKVNDFIKVIESKEDKSIGRIFKYHLSRIYTSFITRAAYYTKERVKIIKEDDLSFDTFQSSFDFLKGLLASKSSEYTDLNAMSKSKKFDDFITESLIEECE